MNKNDDNKESEINQFGVQLRSMAYKDCYVTVVTDK